MVRNELGRNSLSDLGEAMAAVKKVAPNTSPPPLTRLAQPSGGHHDGCRRSHR